MLWWWSIEYILPLFLFFSSSPPPSPPTPNQLQFQLRHAHAVAANSSSLIILNDVLTPSSSSRQYTLNSRPVKRHKLRSQTLFNEARHQSLYHHQTTPPGALWNDEPEEVPGPDTSHLDTLITLAEMTSNSYVGPNGTGWYDLGPQWNRSFPFGWGPDQTGTRGHVFVSTDNSTVVLSIKGTSVPILGGGPTVGEDKLNDNLLFSCCCARVGPTWSTVCGCYAGGGKCNLSCLEKSLVEDSLFYNVATNLYNNITYMYPEANIWIVGHSLGGALASLIGLTFGVPVVAFEAPGERMAAQRLHLPSPPSTQHITHVYHTADPIAMGVCTGVTSSCAVAGYAMESKCHSGTTIVLDTITVLGWSSNVQNHPISVIIDKVLNVTDVDWGWGMLPPPEDEDGDDNGGGDDGDGESADTSAWMRGWWPWGPSKGAPSVPRQPVLPDPVPQEECVDCYAWEFGEF